MSRGSLPALIAAGVGALALTTSAAATAPPALAQALAKTAAARSVTAAFTEKLVIGATKVTVDLHGTEDPATQGGSFVFSIKPDTSGFGQADEILHGNSGYVHFAEFDKLHAKYPGVKSWLVITTTSSLGVDPSSLGTLGAAELNATTGWKTSTGTVAGAAVTNYTGTLALSKASQVTALQQLEARLPSAARFADGVEKVVFAVGSDGYVHRFTGVVKVPVTGGGAITIDIDFDLSGFNASNGAIVPPPASQVMTEQQFDRALGVSAASAAADAISKVSLLPSEIGHGYVLSQIPGGQLVQGEVTLNFCGDNYASEALRTARLQVQYTKKGARFSASNEVVAYQSGGAQEALAEMRKAGATCPSGKMKNVPKGVKDAVQTVKVLHDAHLLPGSVAILATTSAVVKGKRETTAIVLVFQARGNVMSAVYGYGATGDPTVADTLRAAEASAARLKKYVPVAKAKPKPGGLIA